MRQRRAGFRDRFRSLGGTLRGLSARCTVALRGGRALRRGAVTLIVLVTVFNVGHTFVNVLPPALQHAVLGDEAETVLLARSVLRNGYPRLTDPQSYFSGNQGADFGPGGGDAIHGWLPFYAVAAVLAVSPQGDFRPVRWAMLALVLLALWLTYRLCRALTGARWIAFAATGLTFSSLPFVLPLFDIRYFVFAVIGGALLFLGWLRHLRDPQRWGLWVGGAAVALFAQALHPLGMLLAQGLATLWRLRPRAPAQSARVDFVPWLIIAGLAIIPVLVLGFQVNAVAHTLTPWALLTLRAGEVTGALWTLYPLLPLVLPVAVLAALVLRGPGALAVLAMALVFVLAALAATQLPMFRARYLLYLGPLYAALLAYTAASVHGRAASLALALVGGVAIWQSAALVSAPPYRPPGYHREVLRTVAWLNAHARPGDTIYVNFDRRDVLLHTRLRLVRGSDFNSLESNARVRRPVRPQDDPTWAPLEEVRWILWNRVAEQRARMQRTWVNPGYVSVEAVPASFAPRFRFERFTIYENTQPQERPGTGPEPPTSAR